MPGSLLFMKVVDVVSWGRMLPWGLLNADDLFQVAECGVELGQKLL